MKDQAREIKQERRVYMVSQRYRDRELDKTRRKKGKKKRGKETRTRREKEDVQRTRYRQSDGRSKAYTVTNEKARQGPRNA